MKSNHDEAAMRGRPVVWTGRPESESYCVKLEPGPEPGTRLEPVPTVALGRLAANRLTGFGGWEGHLLAASVWQWWADASTGGPIM